MGTYQYKAKKDEGDEEREQNVHRRRLDPRPERHEELRRERQQRVHASCGGATKVAVTTNTT